MQVHLMIEVEHQLRALEDKDIQKILELSKAGKLDTEIAGELAVPLWAIMLIKSLHGKDSL